MDGKNQKSVTADLLRKYYVANYLERKDFYYLNDKLNANLNWGGEY
jgi:hypothetical protein